MRMDIMPPACMYSESVDSHSYEPHVATLNLQRPRPRDIPPVFLHVVLFLVCLPTVYISIETSSVVKQLQSLVWTSLLVADSCNGAWSAVGTWLPLSDGVAG